MYMSVNDVRNYFRNELEEGNFAIDRNGSKTIELLGASFIADEPAIFGEPNQDYISAEIDWYETESTNINTLKDLYGKKPQAWEYSANEHGEINSNYGHLVFSDKYHNQFDKALNDLIHNPDSRRACMVYNRPSIWVEFNEDNKNDFICTNAQTFYIRDGALHMVSQMRSNDVVFGYKNDWAWARHLLRMMTEAYVDATGEKIRPGLIFWQVQNLHVYERHFHLLEEQ